MSVEGLYDSFKKWNPMENDYQNTDFNQYISGPGAALDTALQSGQQVKQQNDDKEQPVPTIIFKNAPNGMTKHAIHNICNKHGRVKSVRDSTKNNFFFVDLATVADLEAVFRGLEKNSYGFEIVIATNNKKKNHDMERNYANQHVNPVTTKSGIDYQKRSLVTSNKQHPRPKIQQNHLVSIWSAADKTGFPLKLLEDDAHYLERQGLSSMPSNKNFIYRNGRAYNSMPQRTEEFINKKHSESSGAYNASSGKYIHESKTNLLPNDLNKCYICYYACDTVCARCSRYYCSLECQKMDWPQHRYICGKPRSLQRPPPTIPPDQSGANKSTENLKEKNKNELSTVTMKSTENKNKINTLATSLQHTASQSAISTSNSNSKNLLSSGDSQNKENIIPRSGSIVTITSICKPNVVFIRSKTYEANLAYFKTVDTLQSSGKMLQPLKNIPTSGKMFVVQFQNQFSRALVLKYNSLEEIMVQLMDYGNIEYVKLQDLYVLPEQLFYEPRHAIPVLLKDVPDLYMTKELQTFMYTYLNNINVEIRYKPEDFLKDKHVYAVELIDENTQQNLNKMILKLSKPVEPQNSIEICNRGYLQHVLLPSGDDIEFFVMDNSLMCSGCISCTIKPYVQEIEKFQKQLQLYAVSLPNQAYTPRADEFCIARYNVDGLWYRGVCLEAVGDGHPSIHFVDYGNITIVPIEDIRSYPRQFTFPIYTADCEIKGLPHKCSDELIAKLEQLIPNGQTIKCQNVTVFEDNFYTLTLPSILREVAACGLFKNGTQSL